MGRLMRRLSAHPVQPPSVHRLLESLRREGAGDGSAWMVRELELAVGVVRDRSSWKIGQRLAHNAMQWVRTSGIHPR